MADLYERPDLVDALSVEVTIFHSWLVQVKLRKTVYYPTLESQR